MTWWKPKQTQEPKKESPDDFMMAYDNYLKENGYEDKNVRPTPKAFAILRRQRKEKSSSSSPHN